MFKEELHIKLEYYIFKKSFTPTLLQNFTVQYLKLLKIIKFES